ncbi:hypothetical protein ACFQZT_33875 [Paenibacillus sp. GCM10027628]|uniref:hypothetical protein n=1 Tax=Paenibacillus sp. GCM10027628 TaxID=3273413 RepID=UPI00362CF656
MNKWKTSAAFILANLLLCTNVFAASNNFNNSDAKNWDKPAKGTLEAQRVENRLLYTKATIEWTSEQIKQFQSDHFLKQFFPAIIYKVSSGDELRAKVMYTNLPGAKFTRKDATNGEGEEIKLSILQTSALMENEPYYFFTGWLHKYEVLDGNPTVSLLSTQRYAQPNGSLSDLPKTQDSLLQIPFNDAELLNIPYTPSESLDSPFRQYTEAVENKKVKSYAQIDSKEKLDQFKIQCAETLKKASNDEIVHFAITFNKYYANPNSLAEEYHLTPYQVYAAGITTKNNEEYTFSWFASDYGAMYIFPANIGFSDFSMTEMEGTAHVEDLKKLSKETFVDVIEIEDKSGKLPTGIHWLNNRFNTE